MIAAGNRSIETSADGQDDLFSGAQHAQPPIELRPAKPWIPTDRLSKEFEAVGFFLTGHPLDDYKDVLESLGAESWIEFAAKARTRRVVGTLAGTVLNSRERKGKSGNAYAFVAFSDPTGQFEAVVFSEARHAGMKIYLDHPRALALLAEQVGSKSGEGQFRIVLRIDELKREVEFVLPQGIDATPKQRSALKMLEGVAAISAL
jgi:DNA polymerase-3 subunit alpha